jgi:Domain of unknown function (DUF5130)
VAHGDHSKRLSSLAERQDRHGRVFAESGPRGDSDSPLARHELELLDDVLREAERSTGLRFAAFIGALGEDTRAGAEALMGSLGPEASVAALVAVSPAQRVVEVVTGPEASRRISERAARLAVLSVVSSCSLGEVSTGVVNGVRILADQAGRLPERTTW